MLFREYLTNEGYKEYSIHNQLADLKYKLQHKKGDMIILYADNEYIIVELTDSLNGYVEVPTDFVIDDNFLRQNHLSTNIVLTKQMKDKLGI